ncbi:MAG: FCD domain-containing protein [Bacteroidia bacterium]|nr:FCD domain-containing protein [Bacteroidia bacterium]
MNPNTHADHLIEAREILEITAVQMAAERRSSENLRSIQAAQDDFREQRLDQAEALEEDLLFHLEVVAASKNSVLKSLYLKIFPDLFDLFNSRKKQDLNSFFEAIYEHDSIIEHISNQNKVGAAEVMKLHLEKSKN